MLASRMLRYGGMLSCARRQDPSGYGGMHAARLTKDPLILSVRPRAPPPARFCIPVLARTMASVVILERGMTAATSDAYLESEPRVAALAGMLSDDVDLAICCRGRDDGRLLASRC